MVDKSQSVSPCTEASVQIKTAPSNVDMDPANVRAYDTSNAICLLLDVETDGGSFHIAETDECRCSGTHELITASLTRAVVTYFRFLKCTHANNRTSAPMTQQDMQVARGNNFEPSGDRLVRRATRGLRHTVSNGVRQKFSSPCRLKLSQFSSRHGCSAAPCHKRFQKAIMPLRVNHVFVVQITVLPVELFPAPTEPPRGPELYGSAKPVTPAPREATGANGGDRSRGTQVDHDPGETSRGS